VVYPAAVHTNPCYSDVDYILDRGVFLYMNITHISRRIVFESLCSVGCSILEIYICMNEMGIDGKELEGWCEEAYGEPFVVVCERFRNEGLEGILATTKRRAKDGNEYAVSVLGEHGIKW